MKKITLLPIFLFALLTAVLFHKQSFGINLFIIEALVIVFLIIRKEIGFKGYLHVISIGSVIISAVFTVITNSAFSIWMNFISVFFLTGLLAYPLGRSSFTIFKISATSFVLSQGKFLESLISAPVDNKFFTAFKKVKYVLIPIPVIALFVGIYSFSNPIFNEVLSKISKSITHFFNYIFSVIDPALILLFAVGLIVGNFIFIRELFTPISVSEHHQADLLVRFRKKIKRNFNFNGLKQELIAGIFLLIVLNAILLAVNIIDIRWVWFGFEFSGQYLKQFVHTGTYLLITSILLSIFIVLFFFRKNLNFYKNNKWIKNLSYIWLGQNMILVISVAIRNFWYISYYSLAYKRIGVIIFLVLVLIGLISVILKVKNKKTIFYLLRINTLAAFILLVISSGFNWDNIIARYNFNNASTSFVHLDYLASLPDRSLPYLDKSAEELKNIDAIQNDKYSFRSSMMSAEDYVNTIEFRKKQFKARWENQSFLSWNLPDYLAYRKLF